MCHQFTWNVTLEYTTTHFNVLGTTRLGNPSPIFHTHQRTLNFMMLLWCMVVSQKLGRKYTVPQQVLDQGPVVCGAIPPSARLQPLHRQLLTGHTSNQGSGVVFTQDVLVMVRTSAFTCTVGERAPFIKSQKISIASYLGSLPRPVSPVLKLSCEHAFSSLDLILC